MARSGTRILRWLYLSALAPWALGACAGGSDNARTTPADASPAPANTTGFLAAPGCNDCLATECAAEVRACASDPACAAVRACRSACDDADCDRACLKDVAPDGGAGLFTEALTRCAEFLCTAQCPGVPVAPPAIAACSSRLGELVAAPKAACASQIECVCTSCINELTACLDDPACTPGFRCDFPHCGTVDCDVTCPPGPPFFALDGCLQTRCGPCLGHDGDAGTP